jgi:hypothetical protein
MAVPLFRGLVPLERSRLPKDIVAGITLAALGMLDASTIDDVDYTAAKMLLRMRTELARRGVEVAFVTPYGSMVEELQRYGLATDRGRFYPSVDAALAAAGA